MKMIVENFSLSRFQRMTLLLLGFGTFLGGAVVAMLWSYSTGYEVVCLPKNKKKEVASLGFTLGVEEKIPSFSVVPMEGELMFSSSLPRPNGVSKEELLFIQLKKNGLAKKITLPERIDLLRGTSGNLIFSEEMSPFWLTLDKVGKKVGVKVWISSLDGKEVMVEEFLEELQETPTQVASEFAERSAFHILGEAKWAGVDLFREKYGEGAPSQRIEIGASPRILELSDCEWLVWKEERWEKEALFPEAGGAPIARLEGVQGKNLLLEGWEGDTYIRLSLGPTSQNLSPKIRGEELFHSIRIRSEKQISCMLEKQCLILRIGDWVLKEGGRWRVLRESQEREALKRGEIMGEIFVFDGIELKQGQKMIQGSFFNANHSQMTPIELPAFSPRKTKEGKG